MLKINGEKKREIFFYSWKKNQQKFLLQTCITSKGQRFLFHLSLRRNTRQIYLLQKNIVSKLKFKRYLSLMLIFWMICHFFFFVPKGDPLHTPIAWLSKQDLFSMLLHPNKNRAEVCRLDSIFIVLCDIRHFISDFVSTTRQGSIMIFSQCFLGI